MPWKNYVKAFPDKFCECMKHDPLPSRCSKCGADRTADNWIDEVDYIREDLSTTTDQVNEMTYNEHGRLINHLGKMGFFNLFFFEIFYDLIKQDDKCEYYESNQSSTTKEE